MRSQVKFDRPTILNLPEMPSKPAWLNSLITLSHRLKLSDTVKLNSPKKSSSPLRLEPLVTLSRPVILKTLGFTVSVMKLERLAGFAKVN